MQNSILVTGTTGFLGSHFLLWLSQHRASRVHALVRGRGREEREAKLANALEAAAGGYRPEPDWEKVAVDTRVVGGDIEEPLCAVSELDRAALRDAQPHEFWHFAASLNFEEKRRELIRSQNIGGPRHAIELAVAVGIERFVYVSTAYTAGADDGRFEEVLHPLDGRFSNVYEESKCEAEHLVTRLCREHGLALTILRPSIVIGSSLTFRPAGTAAGLYGFIRELHRLRRRLACAPGEVRIDATPAAPLNFIPIDAVMRDIMSVIDADFRTAPILHLSASGGISVAHLVASIAGQLGIEGLRVDPAMQPPRSPLEELLSRRIDFYASYLRSQKQFVRSLDSRWAVSDDAFLRYVAEGVHALSAKRLRRDAVRRKRALGSA